jgi:polyphosphate kinase
VLTPQSVDPAHPFPHFKLSFNIGLTVERATMRSGFGIKLPPVIRRLLPWARTVQFVLLEEVIVANVSSLFHT